MNRIQEGESSFPHKGGFQEIIANAERGVISEGVNPNGSTETIVGPKPAEQLDGATIGVGLSGVIFKFWKSKNPNVEGVALTWDGNTSLVLAEEDRVFESIDAAKEWITSQIETKS